MEGTHAITSSNQTGIYLDSLVDVFTRRCEECLGRSIELENDVSVSIQNNPPVTCCSLLVIGAPRLVPDMSSAGDLLLFLLDFYDMSVQNVPFNSFLRI